MLTTSILGYCVFFLLLVWIVRRGQQSHSLPLPPGPKGYPLVGNISDMPHHYPWLTYHNWAKKYGNILHVRIFGGDTIILNSLKASIELLDKRSSNYSDRPRMIMANELMDWDWDFAHMPYSDRWRSHRRSFHQYFQPRNLSSFYPTQRKVTIKLLEQLLHTSDQFAAHIRQYAGSSVLRAAYGYEVRDTNDFYIDLVQTAIQPLLKVVHAGSYIVEYLPSLKMIPIWFPGAGFKRQAKKWAVGARALRDVPFDNLKKLMAEGAAVQSYVYDNLEKLKAEGTTDPNEEEIIKNCAAIMYLAGSDTVRMSFHHFSSSFLKGIKTASLVQSWLLAMAEHPDILSKAQAEVDSVVGKNRLPDFSDRTALPYVEATISETMRWAPVVPLGVPHRAMKEDVYEGYVIPAGATIISNVWSIMHDETMYPEPHKFDPTRFLKTKDVGNVQPDPLTSGVFGFGRRICPGRHFALNSAWIAIASILSTYNVSKSVDHNGKLIELSFEYTDGLVSHPKPFKVDITPRSEDTQKRIESTKLELSIHA